MDYKTRIRIQTRANSFNAFSYNALQDAKSESKTKNQVEGLNELGMTSLGIFRTVPTSHAIASTIEHLNLHSSKDIASNTKEQSNFQ